MTLFDINEFSILVERVEHELNYSKHNWDQQSNNKRNFDKEDNFKNKKLKFDNNKQNIYNLCSCYVNVVERDILCSVFGFEKYFKCRKI